MKTIFRLFALVLISLASTSVFAATPTHTYFLHINGNKDLGEKLAAELMSQDCYTLRDIAPEIAESKEAEQAASAGVGSTTSRAAYVVDPATSQATPSECHAFKKYTSIKQLKGVKTSTHYLLKVRINSPAKKFNLQLFKRDGNDIRRIGNFGDFSREGDFLSVMVSTVKSVTFK